MNLGQVLFSKARREQFVGDQGCNFLVRRSLVKVILRNMRALAGHCVVRLVNGELEGVVAAEAITTVGDVTTDTSNDARLTRLEVGDRVEVPLTGTSDSSSSEVNLAKRGREQL